MTDHLKEQRAVQSLTNVRYYNADVLADAFHERDLRLAIVGAVEMDDPTHTFKKDDVQQLADHFDIEYDRFTSAVDLRRQICTHCNCDYDEFASDTFTKPQLAAIARRRARRSRRRRDPTRRPGLRRSLWRFQRMNETEFDPYGPMPDDQYDSRHDPQPSPEDACMECGEYGINLCGCCGFPLCGKHHELGGGFCSKFFSVGGTPVCAYDFEVYVGVHPRETRILVGDGRKQIHLPDDDDSAVPACDPDGEELVEVTLADFEGELCDECANEARKRYQERQEELVAEMEGEE
jgi:hypothetical protein